MSQSTLSSRGPTLKGKLERLLGSAAASALGRWRLHGARLTLVYHNIVISNQPPVPSDSALHLPFNSFCRQLDAIAEMRMKVIGLNEAAENGKMDPTISITFDDAYAGALLYALPELARRELPATVFVAPGILGSPATWWDRLAEPATCTVTPEIRNAVLNELQGDGSHLERVAATRAWNIQAALGAHRIGTESELTAALRSDSRLTVGSHSWSHRNLASLTSDELREEMERPMEWLHSKWPGRVLDWLAYPYGLESPVVRRAAAEAGYVGALLVRGGWERKRHDHFAVPRLDISSGISLNGFRSRISGFIA